MSYLLNTNILFYIFLLKSWSLTQTASIYSNYKHNFDTINKDRQNYWDNYETELKRDVNELSNNEEYYPQNCKPPIYLTTTTTELSITTKESLTCKPFIKESTEKTDTEAQDVIDHIMNILKTMREHAMALIRNMNELEMNILSTAPASNLEAICKNSTIAVSESANGRGKVVYPDVLYQNPVRSMGDWSFPLQLEAIPETFHTNDFVAEAQEAVKSWKEQIEICKHILESAVRNALKTDNLADSLESKKLKNEQSYNYPYQSFKQLSGDLLDTQNSNNRLEPLSQDFEEELNNSPRKSMNQKYQSLYDILHIKEGN